MLVPDFLFLVTISVVEVGAPISSFTNLFRLCGLCVGPWEM